MRKGGARRPAPPWCTACWRSGSGPTTVGSLTTPKPSPKDADVLWLATDDAYKYAQGATIKHPLGYDIKIDTPMDFMGVTDHSEYVGVTKEANTPERAAGKTIRAETSKRVAPTA